VATKAKKKSRAPAPPRTVQAPRARGTASPEAERRTRLVLYGVAALGLVGLAAVVAFLTVGGGGSSPAGGDFTKAGGRITTVQAAAAGQHVTTPPKRADYNTWPPTSGPHFPSPAPYDLYTEPVEQYRLVHNLEHGGVVVQYGDKVPPATVEQITDWYRDDPNGLVVAPLPELGRRIVLTAWMQENRSSANARGTGVSGTITKFDEDGFNSFVSTYGFKGPEPFTRGDLQPGT
jgi:hypothetical protein